VNADDARTLYAYNRWANRRIVEACRALDDAALGRPTGGSFGSIHDTLAHIAWAEWLWLERWQHRSPKKSSLPGASTLAAIERLIGDVARGQQSFVAELTDDRLDERISYQNIKGETWEYTLAQMLQHTVNHSTYHRGQIVTLLRQAGANGVSTDYLLWIDEGMPIAKS
jgi:uncharacterized damage-inducible protein DinB